MINLVIYGLDQYIVGRLSRELNNHLAEIYNVDADDITFVAPNNMVFHNGVEQTSWDIKIEVHAPASARIFQEEVAYYLLNVIGDIAINKTVDFYYFNDDDHYTKINHEYPRFLTVDNIEEEEYEYSEELDEGEGEDELYTENMFKDFHPDR